MTVSVYTGATESGKSWHVKNRIIPGYKRVVIFDPEGCFSGDSELTAPSDELILKTARKFAYAESFRIVIRPGRLSDPELVFKQVVFLSCTIGRILKIRGIQDRVQAVIDEITSTEIISESYFSPIVKTLILRGRHDFVDAHLIAQNPMDIHKRIRSQITNFSTFFLNEAESVPVLRYCFGKYVGEISELDQYERMDWNNKGVIQKFNSKNQITGNFTKKLRANSGERKVKDDTETGKSRDFTGKKRVPDL